MFNKKPVLEYEMKSDFYPNLLTPSKSHIPEWYKKIPKYIDNELFTVENGFQTTVKACMPFLDSLTVGYMLTLPYDLYIKNNNGAPYVAWKVGTTDTPNSRIRPANNNIVPFGHYPTEYTWGLCVSIKIPKGYSILFTHPLNRHDLPFTTLSGIIDGGMIIPSHGSIPFYIKNNYEGMIEQGTPIAQIIPFRQENWKSIQKTGIHKEGYKQGLISNLKINGWYKKTFWTRKEYL
jgi:hypothetical protein